MGKTRNSLGIRFVTGGPPQLRATLNEIIAAFDRVRVRRSVDIDAVDNVDGTLLTIRNPTAGGRARGAAAAYPLDLTLVDAGDDFTGVFRPGTHNGKLPANYHELEGIPKTGVAYIVLTSTMNAGQPTACTFSAETSAPGGYPVQIDVPPATLEILTHIVAEGRVFRVLGPGNIVSTVVESFRVAKPSPGPGERVFNSYYTYTVDSSA